MTMDFFRLTATRGTKGSLYLTESALDSLGKARLDRIVVSHGARRLVASVVPILEPGSIIPASADVFDGLGLLEGVPYRMRWDRTELRIGPVMAVHAADKTGDLDISSGGLLRLHFTRYPQYGGLAFAFASDGVDEKTGTIRGYYWQPDEGSPYEAPVNSLARLSALAQRVESAAAEEVKTPPYNSRTARFQAMAGEFLREVQYPSVHAVPNPSNYPGAGSLRDGTFPIPSAVWRRSGYMPPEVLSYLQSATGNRVFNSEFFDKMQGYLIASGDPRLCGNIPKTSLFTSTDGLLSMLAENGVAQVPAGRLVVFSVDARGGVSTVLAGPDGRGLPVEAADVLDVPGSAELDDSPLDECLTVAVMPGPARRWASSSSGTTRCWPGSRSTGTCSGSCSVVK
jgi:hypothetical protein